MTVQAFPARALVTDAEIDPASVLGMVGGPEDGAALLFLGQVRNHHEGKAVTSIRYEAYEAMAVRELERIVEDVATEWGVDRLAVVHRVGALEVGEVSVAVAASSPHRAESFAATRAVMEEIKRRAPVWKYETYADGTSCWVRGTPVEVPEDGTEGS